MNKAMNLLRRIFKCPFGDHVVHLSRQDFQLLNEMRLTRSCSICGIFVIIDKRDQNTYWEIEDVDSDPDI